MCNQKEMQMSRKPFKVWAVIRLLVLAFGALVASTAVAGASTRTSAGSSPVVPVATGAVRGMTVGGVNEFLGIPYAAPPVGSLRWQPPQRAASWTGVRQATTYGPNCPQTATPFGLASTSENCLYLNVYAPAGSPNQMAKHPVMVWIHGGGLWLGESQDVDPATLAAKGTVVITINYRLGALGFLAHPALTRAAPEARQAITASWTNRRRCAGFSTTSLSSVGIPTMSRLPANPPVERLFWHNSYLLQPEACSSVPSWRAGPSR